MTDTGELSQQADGQKRLPGKLQLETPSAVPQKGKPARESWKIPGLLIMVAVEFLFAASFLLVKLLSNFGALELTFWRSLIMWPILMGMLWSKGLSPWGQSGQHAWLIVRGFFGFGAMCLLYYAIQRLPLNDAVVITYTNPVMTGVAAALLLKEKLEIIYLGGISLCMIGVTLVGKPSFVMGLIGQQTAPLHADGVVAALCAAMCATAVYILLRYRKDLHPLVATNYFAMAGVTFSPVLMLAFGEAIVIPTEVRQWLALLLVAVLSIAGQSLTSIALRRESAGKAAAINYLQVAFATIFEITIFKKNPDTWEVVGSLLIASWGVIALVKDAKKGEEKQTQETVRASDSDLEKNAAGTSSAPRKYTDLAVLVCGSGNAAQVVTGLLGTRYKTIALSLRHSAKWKAALGGDAFELTVQGAYVNKIVSKPAAITNDPSVAKDADVIILAVPSFAHGEYFEKLAPHMKPGTIVGVMPACSGGDILFANKLGDKAKDMVFVAFDTLPWACRFSEWGRKATILGTKGTVRAAVTPQSNKQRALGTLQDLLGASPCIIESSSNLAISLRSPAQIFHPGIMYARWGPESWDGKAVDEKPLFYHGIDDFTVKVLIAMQDEVQTVCRKMEALVPSLNLKEVCTLKQCYLDAYDGQMSDTSTLKACMNTNKAHTGLEHPCIQGEDKKFLPDLDNRYLAEDCTTGLCFSKGLAELCEISTPTIDKVISWAQQSLGKEWLVDGKMQGKNVSETRAPQGVGIKTIDEFVIAAKFHAGQ